MTVQPLSTVTDEWPLRSSPYFSAAHAFKNFLTWGSRDEWMKYRKLRKEIVASKLWLSPGTRLKAVIHGPVTYNNIIHPHYDNTK